MFNKKSCKKCGKKASDKYEFCPHCGSSFNPPRQEDWGMLGKEDTINEFEQLTNSLFGGMGGKMIGKMFNSTMKMLEKEMQKGMNQPQNQPRTQMELFINGKKINLTQQPQQNPQRQIQKQVKKTPSIKLPQEKLKGFYKLSQKEPLTDVRRLSDRVIYEIKMPGIKSEKELSITPLENTIEIKAMTKTQAYFKIIPLGLPIINYSLSKGSLVLELGMRN